MHEFIGPMPRAHPLLIHIQLIAEDVEKNARTHKKDVKKNPLKRNN